MLGQRILLGVLMAAWVLGAAPTRAREARPVVTADIFDVSARNLLGSFGRLNDLGDMEECAALFAEDGVLYVSAEKKGRAEIKEWLIERAAKSPYARVHLTGNIIATQDAPNRGHAVADVVVFAKNEKGVLGLETSVRYTTEYVRKNGVWLIARLTVGG